MSFDPDRIARAVAGRGRVARVVVAATRGSAPREPGAAMLVWPEGAGHGQEGTIGGGALELAATRRALAVLAAGGPDLAERHPLGPAHGQCCGGAVTLVTEIWGTNRLSGLSGPTYRRRIAGAAPCPGALTRAEAPALPIFADGWLAEAIAPPVRPLWIWGAGHVGRAIAATLAPLPGLAITWADIDRARFPADPPEGVRLRAAADPADLIPNAPPEADHLIVTHSHALDLALCHGLLRHGFRSAGLIGSATKRARFARRLRALGHGEAAIARIACPIGDPRLGKHPQAIAIGVAAALLAPAPRPAPDVTDAPASELQLP